MNCVLVLPYCMNEHQFSADRTPMVTKGMNPPKPDESVRQLGLFIGHGQAVTGV